MKKVDMHMHSNVSDGLYSPAELMKLADTYGLSAVGLTDHDNVEGLPEAESAASEFGIELIPGVEISILHNDEEIHILGYYPRKLNLLCEALKQIQSERFRRMEKMVDRLKRLGFKIKFDEVLEEAGNAAPGRMHLARLLYKKKYVHTVDEAFSLYLTRNREAYVPRETMSLKQAMALLRKVGAVIVAAHPGYNKTDIVGLMMPMGLHGIEVFHPDHSKQQERKYKNMALENKLLITGGSDFHGDNRKNIRYSLQWAISEKYLQQLKEAAGQRQQMW